MSQNISEPSSIERDLEQTRSRLDGHLGQLQARLTPGQVVDDLMRYFRGREGAEFGRNLVESVRTNPLPAAITGIGLTWLMATNSRPPVAVQGPVARPGVDKMNVYRGTAGFNEGGYDAISARIRSAEQGVTRGQGEEEHVYTGRLDAARGQAIGLSRHAQETAESFSQRISNALAGAQQAVTESAHDLRDQVGRAASSVGSAAQGAGQAVGGVAQRAGSALGHGGQAAGQAGGSLVTALTESPVLLGALGLAAGALLGALLPQSEQEQAALGDIAGQARDSARALAQEAVDKGTHVAQAVVEKGRDSAGSHGLTGDKSPGELVDAAMSGSLAKDAKRVAQDVLQASDEAVRKEALKPGDTKPA